MNSPKVLCTFKSPLKPSQIFTIIQKWGRWSYTLDKNKNDVFFEYPSGNPMWVVVKNGSISIKTFQEEKKYVLVVKKVLTTKLKKPVK